MKIENLTDYTNLTRIHTTYNIAKQSLADINEFLNSSEDYHLSDGGITPFNKKALYGLHIHTNSDGSGLSFNLTGLKLHFAIAEVVKGMLEKKIAELEAEIKAL
jgi:hypothetical protein